MNRQSANEKEKIDRHIVLDIDSEENYELFERLGKALSSRVRIRMLALLKHKSMNIVELAQELTIPVSSAAFHVNMLEEANLINTEIGTGNAKTATLHQNTGTNWPGQPSAEQRESSAGQKRRERN